MKIDPQELSESFGTLSETINGLKQLGYAHDFNMKEECLVCHQTNVTMSPDDFRIDKVYRFEGDSNPDDESVVYAISSSKYDLRGTLVNGYGISADEATNRLVEVLETHTKKAAEPKTVTANDATPQRPEGNRVLDAPLVRMNLKESIEQLQHEDAWQNSDRNSVTLFKSDTMRIVLLGLHENAELKPHKANGVISVQVIKGTIDFMTAEDHCTLEEGRMIALHKNIIHSVKALEDSFFVLTLSMEPKS